MPSFALRNAGAECFALLLDGEHVGSVFQSDESDTPWFAIIHRAGRLPLPFTMQTHRFNSLEDLTGWLSQSGA